VSTRRLKLRYADVCAICAVDLPPGTEAEWDRTTKTATCIVCLEEPAPVVSGPAGGSARAMADRHRSEREAKTNAIKTAHPILGRLALAIDPLPDRGKPWEKGAIGEERFGTKLDELSRARAGKVLVLHDRRIPRTTANIDHIAVTPSGVWVIDAKRYTGKVDYVNKGGWFTNDFRLTVGGRDRTKVVLQVHKQLERMTAAMASSPYADVALHGALCFVDAEWGLFAKAFSIRNVHVTWGKELCERLVADGPIDEGAREAIHRHIAASFPPAV
jgi:hypothetical protein